MKPFVFLASAAALAALTSLSAPAGASTKTLPNCSRNMISSTGTNAATTGMKTTVNSDEPNTSGPPVEPNTPANTNASNINSGSPGVHMKSDPCKVTTHTHHHKKH